MSDKQKILRVPILLDTFEKVHAFVAAISVFDNDFTMYGKGNESIDAKSVLGIFLMDLSRPHELIISEGGDHTQILEAIKPYIYHTVS